MLMKKNKDGNKYPGPDGSVCRWKRQVMRKLGSKKVHSHLLVNRLNKDLRRVKEFIIVKETQTEDKDKNKDKEKDTRRRLQSMRLVKHAPGLFPSPSTRKPLFRGSCSAYIRLRSKLIYLLVSCRAGKEEARSYWHYSTTTTPGEANDGSCVKPQQLA